MAWIETKNWDRTKIAHDLIASRKSKFRSSSAKDAIKNAYARGETDEFMSATSINLRQADYDITKDSALFFNFRADRARQITTSLSKTDFNEFSRQEATVFKKLFDNDGLWRRISAANPLFPNLKY